MTDRHRYQDSSVRRSHRRQSRRKRTNRLLLLSAVCGVLCLGIAGLLAVGALVLEDQLLPPLAIGYAVAGVLLLLIRGVVGVVREKKKDRRSQYRQRAQRLSSDLPPRVMPPRDGGALVLVLVVLALVGALVMQAQVTARVRQRLEHVSLQRTRLQTAAADAIFQALETLADDDDLVADYPDEDWAQPFETERPDGMITRVILQDRQRLFDLNNLYLESAAGNGASARRILQDIFTLCGEYGPVDRIDALQDWIDVNDQGFREQAFYRALDPTIRVPNRWLLSAAELFLVDGFEREAFQVKLQQDALESPTAMLNECLGVIPGRRSQPVPVNLNTAPGEVLRAVFGLGREAVVSFVESYRRERPLRSLEVLAPLVVAEPDLIEALRPFVDVGSHHFEAVAMATLNNQALQVRAEVFRDAEGDVHVVRWIL